MGDQEKDPRITAYEQALVIIDEKLGKMNPIDRHAKAIAILRTNLKASQPRTVVIREGFTDGDLRQKTLTLIQRVRSLKIRCQHQRAQQELEAVQEQARLLAIDLADSAAQVRPVP